MIQPLSQSSYFELEEYPFAQADCQTARSQTLCGGLEFNDPEATYRGRPDQAWASTSTQPCKCLPLPLLGVSQGGPAHVLSGHMRLL